MARVKIQVRLIWSKSVGMVRGHKIDCRVFCFERYITMDFLPPVGTAMNFGSADWDWDKHGTGGLDAEVESIRWDEDECGYSVILASTEMGDPDDVEGDLGWMETQKFILTDPLRLAPDKQE